MNDELLKQLLGITLGFYMEPHTGVLIVYKDIMYVVANDSESVFAAEWNKDSTLVNDEGEPIVPYHGLKIKLKSASEAPKTPVTE